MPAGERGLLRALDLDLIAAFGRLAERSAAVKESHLVLLEKEQDSLVVLPDHLRLAPEHPVHLQPQALHLDAVLGEMLAGLLVVLG
jgi:hypothetical protein